MAANTSSDLSSHTSHYSESIVQINIPVSTKLDRDNFLTWKSQIEPIIHGYGLSDYIDESATLPSKNLVINDISTPNPSFQPWIRQDQLLLGWMRSTITSSILSQYITSKTTAHLWSALHRVYAAVSSARVMELRRSLQSKTQGSQSFTDYFTKMLSISDQLSSAGVSLPESDLVNYILTGLGAEFNSFVVALTTRSDPISLSDLHGFLLAHETLLSTQNRSQSSFSTDPTALYATSHNRGRGRSRGSGHGYVSGSDSGNGSGKGSSGRSAPLLPTPNSNLGRGGPVQNQFHNRSGYPTYSSSGRGSSSQSTADRPTCQICFKRGHEALDCHYRFNHSYTSAAPPQFQAFVNTTSQSPHDGWFLDSGATNHVTPDLNNLNSFLPYTGSDHLQVGNGSNLPIRHLGHSLISYNGGQLHLTNVLHVPSITKNLISISKLTLDNDVLIEFHPFFCIVKDCRTMTPLLQAKLHNGLYNVSHSPQAFIGERVSSQVWHARLGHPSSSTTSFIINSNKLPTSSNKLPLCSDCCKAKAHVLPFTPSTSIVSSPLEVIHSDLWGPSPIVSCNGFRYYVHFIDEFSRFSWIYFLRTKDEVVHVFSLFKAQVENLLGTPIKILQTDGGTEYKPIAKRFSHLRHQISCPHTPQQNGLAERKHRHIIELSLAIMSHAAIPSHYWDHIFQSVVFLINRLPPTTSPHISPYTSLFQRPPDYTFLRVLGCLCFPLGRPYNKHKLQFRSLPCVFLSYCQHQKGYKCFHLPTNKIYVSRNVRFDETSFPFSSSFSSAHLHDSLARFSSLPTPDSPQLPLLSPSCSFPFSLLQPKPISPSQAEPTSSPSQAEPIFSSPSQAEPISFSPSQTEPLTSPPSQAAPILSSLPAAPATPLAPPPATTTDAATCSQHHMVTRHQDRSRKIKKISDHVTFLTTRHPLSPFQLDEPTSFTKANQNSDWRHAMATELNALAHNNTWILVPPPPESHIIGCKWIYKLKRKFDGSIERHKARLVAKGFTQEEGLDYNETFSPVVKPTTIRVVLSLAVSRHWPIRQLDVNNAFLHGDLHEQVYMAQPPGFLDPLRPSHVCLIKKALYGLKQAPRAWFYKLASALSDFGFNASHSDPSLFIRASPDSLTFVLVYVDDIIITGSHSSHVTSLICNLASRFSLKDLGPLHFFLGIQVSSTSHGIHLSQPKYIRDLLIRSKMDGSKPCSTPCTPGHTLSKFDGSLMTDAHHYRSVVGALQYATITRPDISYAVNKASQFMHAPTDTHWGAVKRILRYLKGTISHGIHIHASPSLDLHAYSDADWAGCPDDRRSTTGFCVFLGPNLLSWGSKKQHTVSRSSTEAEYRSMAIACAELIWIQQLLRELHVPLVNTPSLWCDNLGATFLASNPVFHARTKHIEIDFHFVRERVVSNDLKVRFICSKDQLADLLTKGLTSTRLQFLCSKLGVDSATTSLAGGY